MKNSNFHQETKAIHAADGADKDSRPLSTPIFQTATFEVKAIEEQLKAAATDSFYTRYGNPNFTACETTLAALELAEAALVFSSGMAAITNSVLAVVQAGDHVIAQSDLYGTTYKFFTQWLPRYGIEITFIETNNLDEVKKALRPNTKLLYLETPTNPILKLVDLKAMAAWAKTKSIITIVDNTFNSPINLQPLPLGIDVVVHSATKYLCGHADLVCGAVASSADFIRKIYGVRSTLGSIMDAHAAWLLLRGMRSLPIRIERVNQNALRIAEFLQHHKSIKKVYYPFLASHPQYELAMTQMKGGGGIVTFEIKGSEEQACKIVNSLKLFAIAPSLGGLESLVTMPALTTHFEISKEERMRIGVSDQLIRLAIGIENVEDLIADLEQALNK